ncbi:FtsX-like permease family protein [Salinispora vitiensis]|uniref:FtsX-like permease family protein n=1 Tax=Salinispora vitiensis TaxID=999544 RepID=UPI001CC6BA42|nr:ABC transporter permease [Salinispora vitiensis]
MTSFIVLTGTAETSRLDVTNTVAANARAAFDILVRPADAGTDIESSAGLVRPNFISETEPGISLAEVDAIRQIPGVEVAAPVAVLGIGMPDLRVPIDLSQVVPDDERSAYRITLNWRTDREMSQFSQGEPSYVYFTPNPVAHKDVITFSRGDGPKSALDEITSSGARMGLCGQQVGKVPPLPRTSPMQLVERAQCYSLTDDSRGYVAGKKAFFLEWRVPYVMAAIDPQAEADLVGLDQAMVSGDYLSSIDVGDQGEQLGHPVPVIAANQPFVDQEVMATVERLPDATAEQFPGSLENPAARGSFADAAPGETVATVNLTSADATNYLLRDLGSTGGNTQLLSYWTASPTEYSISSGGALVPQEQDVPLDVWRTSQIGDLGKAPATAGDVSFRSVESHRLQPGKGPSDAANLVLMGRFDPTKIDSFSALSEVPLAAYQVPSLLGADEQTQQLLQNQVLLPSGNPAGYLQQPPLLLTTLDAATAFQGAYGSTPENGPVSAIRIKVAGVNGIDDVSRERVRVVAERIFETTGLTVDVTLGSSPSGQTVLLPAGELGRPELKLKEWWTKKGVAVVIKDAVERKSLIIFVLVLAVCGLFIWNASAAAVRARRAELGVLACVGWSRRALFGVVLGELAVLGLLAGSIGAVASRLAGVALDLDVSWSRALLAVPVAVTVSVLSGLIPARAAARADPLAALRPPVSDGPRGHLRFGILGLVVTNIRRVPGRTFLGAGALAVAIASLVLLLSITWAFEGALVGSLLGEAVAVQVRTPDIVAVAAMLTLAAVAVMDVTYLNVQDRVSEFAVLEATGWSRRSLTTLVISEGAILGLIGAVVGVVVGMTLSMGLAGGEAIGRLAGVSVAVGAIGIALSAAASLLPAQAIRRNTIATFLSGD